MNTIPNSEKRKLFHSGKYKSGLSMTSSQWSVLDTFVTVHFMYLLLTIIFYNFHRFDGIKKMVVVSVFMNPYTLCTMCQFISLSANTSAKHSTFEGFCDSDDIIAVFHFDGSTRLILNVSGCSDIVPSHAGGYAAHSLAIMSDAAHLLTDFGSIMISLFSLWISSKPPSKNMTFGWHRAGLL